MRLEANLFLLPGAFFLLVAVVYGVLTDFQELVGFPAILLSAGLAFMVGIYFRMLNKRHGIRPEDRADAAISEESGDQGLYAPWSWWPLVLAFSAALAMIGLAVGTWMMPIGVAVFAVAIVGWVYEYYRGNFAR